MAHSMTFKSFTGLFAVAVIFSAALAARAADEPKKEGEKPNRSEKEGDRAGGDRGQMLARLLEGLNLTDEQKEKVKAVQAKNAEARTKWEAENKDKLDPIRAKMQAAREKQDREGMRAAFEELRKVSETAPRPDLMAQMKDILTAEQLEKLQKRMDELKERFKGGRPGKEKPPEKKPEV